MSSAVLIEPSGQVYDFDFGTNNLKSLQNAVGGWIEHVALPYENLDGWGNDEAAVVAEPQWNVLATAALFQLADWPTRFYGPLALTGGNDDEGNTLPLADDQIAQLKGFLKVIAGQLDLPADATEEQKSRAYQAFIARGRG